MSKELSISTITIQVAEAISSSPFNQIEEFAIKAKLNEYIMFTHYNFYYSYPEFGKKWLNGKDCEFHRINTKCNECEWMPERNYAGIGTIFLLNNAISHLAFRRMILLCPTHIEKYVQWNEYKKTVEQLSLFNYS